jgi:hypothetical protein
MNHRPNNEEIVSALFKKMGLTNCVKADKFWRGLLRQFGDKAESLLASIEQRGSGVNTNPYSIKNTSFEFANAVASQYDANKLKSFAVWFLNENLSIGDAVLEVGCDNGILTCALASVYPLISFVGIDPCAEAIAIATERSRKMGLTNIEFRVSDLDLYALEADQKKFSVIIAVAVFHELIAHGKIGSDHGLMGRPNPDFSLFAHDENWINEKNDVPSLASISSLLSKDGVFVSADRWSTSTEVLRWVRLAEHHGLKIDLNASALIEFKNESLEKECFPVSVFSKRDGEVVRACDALAFAAYKKFPDINISDDNSAELLYEALDRSEVLLLEFVYNNGSGILRIHMGLAGGVGYIYRTSSLGSRKLSVFPSVFLNEYLKKSQDDIAKMLPFTTFTEKWANNHLQEQLQINPPRWKDI